MKQKLLVAPLLSITLLLIFSYPLQNSETKVKFSQPGSPLVVSGRTEIGLNSSELQLKKTLSILKSTNSQEILRPAVDSKDITEKEPELELDQFIAKIRQNKTDHILRGVHVAGTLALEVEQQPRSNAVYVSTRLGTVTQFKSAADNGIVGLLAHNFLSGLQFYNLKIGQEVHLIYGDGKFRDYQVAEINRFQKLDPSSLSSDLIEMSTGKRFTTNQVFNRYYTGNDHVTFQTCLAGGGISNWGLVFIVATPLR